MNTPKKNVSRLQFLKDTSIIATGLTFFPGFVSASIKDTNFGTALLFGKGFSVQLVIPQQASAIEKFCVTL